MDLLIELLKERARDPGRAVDERTGSAAPKLAPPVTAAVIAQTEQALGFRIPELLRRIYSEVAAGGFGPGYGLLPVSASPGDEGTISARYRQWQTSQKSPQWPFGLLPLCEWGAGISSFVDCAQSEAPVIRLDPNMPRQEADERIPEPMRYIRADEVKEACWVESPSLAEWLSAWVDDVQLFYAAYRRPGEDDDAEGEDEDEEEDLAS